MSLLERLFHRRPKVWDLLHRIHMVRAISQTNAVELAALAKYAARAKIALEIGSFQGVSAATIARNLQSGGYLYCVDPWPSKIGHSDPVFQIFIRHLNRTKTTDKIRIIRDFSANVADRLPTQLDFAFIDGDHSWEGIEVDWAIVAPRLKEAGVICLHDTAIPSEEPWRDFESCHFYDLKIRPNNNFELVDTVYSMRILRKR
jgi:predicted O-methyltransferase YrrM